MELCNKLNTLLRSPPEMKSVSRNQVLQTQCFQFTSASAGVRTSYRFWHFFWSGAFKYVLTPCQKGKTSATIWEKKLSLPIGLGMVTRQFPNNLEVTTLQWKWSILRFKVAASLPRDGPLLSFLRGTVRKPRATSQIALRSVSMLNFEAEKDC